MGVRSCDRSGCSNVMCDTHVNDIGSICNECKEEFKQYLQENDVHYPETEIEIQAQLKLFMITRKGAYLAVKNMTVDEFFEQHTR